MRFNPFEGLKKAVDLKNESETVKKIKADMISASDTIKRLFINTSTERLL